MPRLASPIGQIRSHYAVVVVGSGFGGAIAAPSLARVKTRPVRWVADRPLTLTGGRFSLFVPDPDHVEAKQMRYKTQLTRDVYPFMLEHLAATAS